MPATRSIQTAFRFTPQMLSRMKNRARLRGQSLNSYVESLIAGDLGGDEDRYEVLYAELSEISLPVEISSEIKSLSQYSVEFSQEEIDADERLKYILSK